MKNKKTKNKIWLVVDVIVILIVAYFILGYINFFKISKNEKPLFEGEKTSYVEGIGNVTVNDYTIYKIVKYEIPNQNVTYSMKLWFMDDIK